MPLERYVYSCAPKRAAVLREEILQNPACGYEVVTVSNEQEAHPFLGGAVFLSEYAEMREERVTFLFLLSVGS